MVDNLLLVEGDAADAQMLMAVLAESKAEPCRVELVASLSECLKRLKSGGISLVLLDLFLSDSRGVETFDKLHHAFPHVPVLIIGTLAEEGTAEEVCRRGAKDYLIKTQLGGNALPRAIRHIIDRVSLEKAWFVEIERARVTLDSIGDAVLSTDMSGKVSYLNRVAERMTGWPQAEAKGRPLAEIFKIIDGITREPAPDPLENAIEQNKTVGLTTNCVLIRRDGEESAIEDASAPIRDADGQVTGAVIVFRDVDAARALTLKMSHLAHHDPLTDLPNRSLLVQRLTQAIALARRHNRQLAVMFADLDHFKDVNDTLGHAVGDKLLQSVALRLLSCLRISDTVTRQGGDEFVLLLVEITEKEDAAVCAEKIMMSITASYPIAGHALAITASIGISIYPEDGQDAETLIKAADTAMYYAKEQGRNKSAFFNKTMTARAVEQQSLEDDLRNALKRQEFVLFYQAQIDLKTGMMAGTEALIRWQHPKRGLLGPADFIPIAEACGLIVPIGQWVLREACRQTRAWLDAGLRPIRIAVNISALEFRNKHFVQGLRLILDETGLEPHYLELELTESVLMEDVAMTGNTLAAIKAMGLQLAIDDFGTGYSSLSYLTRFQVDTLKVDQSFVRQMAPDPDNVILGAVIAMAKNLRHRVVAEGIETPGQLALLQALNCGQGQGYLFDRPRDAGGFATLMERDVSDLFQLELTSPNFANGSKQPNP